MSFIKKLTASVAAASLVLGLVGTAFAAPSASETNAAFDRLSHYSIVQGVAGPTGEVTPALDQAITRAQLLAILVRAWGQESNAKLLQGATTGFADVDGNAAVAWTTGYIFIGSRIAETNGGPKLGMGANFVPSGNLTAAETLAFVMKFLGLKAGTGATWVADTIKAAKDAGLLTDADEAKYLANPTAQVNRGEAFAMLDSMFAGYNKLEGGKTIYTAFIDNKAPELTVNKPELTTDKAALTITGSVKGDYTSVLLGSQKITVNTDGTFSVEAPLVLGANNFVFTALDRVGNTAEQSFTVTRNPGVAAKLTATVPAAMNAGDVADVTINVTDANDVKLDVVAADIDVTTSGNVGTYDATTGKFTAAEKVATGTVTVKYGELVFTADVKVNAGPLAQLTADKTSVAKGDTIQLTAADKYGNVIATGVTYTADKDGIAVTTSGVVYTATSGKYVVTAKTATGSATATIGVYGDVAGIAITEAPASLVANGTTQKAVKVTVVDEFGNRVTGYDGNVTLKADAVNIFDSTEDDALTDVGTLVVAAEDGVATFYISFESVLANEQVTLTASTLDANDETVKAEKTVDALAPVATSLKVASAPKYLAANYANDLADTTKQVTVKVVDQEGVAVDETFEVAATINTPYVLIDDKSNYSGVADATFVLSNHNAIGQEGTINLTFTVEGLPSATASIKHVNAGNPDHLVVTPKVASATATNSIEVKVEVVDRAGVPVFIYKDDAVTLTVHLNADEDNVTNDAAVLDAGADTTTFNVSTTADFTGNVTVKVTATVEGNKAYDITGSTTIAFTADDPVAVEADRDYIWAPVANPKASFVVSLKDDKGNSVVKEGTKLVVWAYDIDAWVAAGSPTLPGSEITILDFSTNITVNGVKTTTAKPLKVKSDANGQVKLDLVARPYSDVQYGLLVGLADEDGNYVADSGFVAGFDVVQVVPGSIATKLYKTVVVNEVPQYVAATSVTAGDNIYMKVSVKDNYGGAMTGVADVLEVVANDETFGVADAFVDADGISIYEYDDPAIATESHALGLVEGDYLVIVQGAKAGVQSLGVKHTYTQTELTKSSSIQVKPGALTQVVANGGKAIEVDDAGKVYGPYTLSLADVFGNTVALTTNQTITLSSDSKITFRAIEGGATKTQFSTRSSTSFWFVATAERTYTVTWSIDGTDLTGTFDITVGE